MLIWKINNEYLQQKDAFFSWVKREEIQEEALSLLDDFGVFYKKIKGENCRLGPLNVKCENLEVYIGSKCTMNCTFCMTKAFYEHYGTSIDVEHYDLEAIEYYIDVLQPENIFFSGGEPPDYADRIGHLINLLKTKYNSGIRIILDTSGEHIDNIRNLKKMYPNMTISVTIELPMEDAGTNLRGQNFYALCDNLEALVSELSLSQDDFNVKPYFAPGFDPKYFEYLISKGFKQVETDVYHQVRPNVPFPHYTDKDLRKALSLVEKFDSINPGDINPVYFLLSDSGNPCIKNISQFKMLEKDYVCRHDFNGDWEKGSLENYYENKAGIYKIGLEYGEGYCCALLKNAEQSATATNVVKCMAALRVKGYFLSLGDKLHGFIDSLNRLYEQMDAVLSFIDISIPMTEMGDVLCHMSDDYYNLKPNDVVRYKHFLGYDSIDKIHVDSFKNLDKYEDDQLVIMQRRFGYYTFSAIGKKADIQKCKSKTYWYNNLLKRCVNEQLSIADTRK